MHGCFITQARAAQSREKKANAQLMREVRALLQELVLHEGWLAREDRSDGMQWWLHAPAERGARALRRVAASLVAALKERDFITPMAENDPLRWRISARGRRWLATHMPGLRGVLPERAPDATEEEEEAPVDAAPKPPKKARQRLLVRDAETGRLQEVEVNLRENPLMWLARRKDAQGRPYLEAHHVAAGERLRQDYETARMQPKLTASWNAALVASDRARLKSGPRDPYPFTEVVLMARERLQRALEAIGPELADVVVAVCCLGHGIEAAEKALAWPRRSARLVLRIALERLAAHYGIHPVRKGPEPRWKTVLSWHATGGVPELLMPQENAYGQELPGASEIK